MGTEIAISFNSLRTQLENERSSLFKIDENIKRIVQTSGRFPNDRFNQVGHYNRSGQQTGGGRNSFVDFKNYKNDDLLGKRKTETKTVFSRLSARTQDSDGEDDFPGVKRAKVPSAVCRELPTRAAVLRAQGDDEQARTRNRRIFGSLLGTLQKFKQEEIVLQTKEEKKAQVERKIEEQARLEKEREQKERKTLFAERESKKATIKALEAKMGRVQEFERWEASQKNLANFILTKTRPHIYWLPKKMTDKATEKLNSSRKFHEKCMIKKRLELQDELQRIEQKCLRSRGPGTKENNPEHRREDKEKTVHSETEEHNTNNGEDKGSKRNKFAMDVDEKEREDSDGDERHDEGSIDKSQVETVKEEEIEEKKMDTSTEQEAAVETSEIKENTESTDSTEESTKENLDSETKETKQDIEMREINDNTEHS
ncbi:pinin isoform X2 [Battus philenor]|uniref:pinin isoform X2 n=1 Tax=Battus philenor TaxID=42288 RepID=UPI0035CF21FF